MPINFKDLITIDKMWVNEQLTHHYSKSVNDKLKVSLFTITPSGTTINPNSLANSLLDIMPYYYKPKSQIEKEIKRQIDKIINAGTTATEIELREEALRLVYNRTYRDAAKFFKKKTTQSKSGKYGELLLFGLVECLLECKMIAHKITNITNYHDEIKGGDGIFLGDYELQDGRKVMAYLIGESKVWKDFYAARIDALESIDRFYKPDVQATFKSLEFFIARKDINEFSEGLDIDELYDRLDPNSLLFKDQIAVHPILIMYETEAYQKLMKKASDKTELDKLINDSVEEKMGVTLKGIGDKLSEYTNLENVYIDFILIPTDSVESFNMAMDALI